MKCKNCNGIIKSTDKFCPYCGTKIENSNFIELNKISEEFTVESNLRLVKEFKELQKKFNSIRNDYSQIKSNVQNNLNVFLSKRNQLEENVVKKINFMRIEEIDYQKFTELGYSDLRDLIYFSTDDIFNILFKPDSSMAILVRKYIDNVLRDEINKIRIEQELKNYISNSYKLHGYDAVCSNFDQIYDQINSSYSNYVSKLQSVDSKLKWMFTFGKKKEGILEYYQILKDLINNDLYDVINDLEFQISKVKAQDINIKNKVFNNPAELFQILSFKDKNFDVEKFNIGLEKINQLQSKYFDSNYNFNEEKKTIEDLIKKTADKVRGEEIFKRLKEMPLEQLNKTYKYGSIRISPLKKNGYNNLSDITTLTESHLCAFNGIGPDSARAIRTTLSDIVKELKEVTKIKLNYDSQSKYSSELTQLLSRLVVLNSAEKQMNQLNGYSQYLMHSSYYDIVPACSIYWRFGLERNCSRVLTGIQTLDNILNGAYGQQRRQIVDFVNSAMECTAKQAWDSFKENPIAFNTALENVVPDLVDSVDDKEYGLPIELAQEIQDQCFFPEGLLCTLRNYQEWGVKYTLHQEKVLIGDEMGLGKTIQAIATMVSLKNTGASHFLVVCPASVLSNWCREIRKHSLLNVIKIHGSDKVQSLNTWKKRGGVGVTTYETTGYFKFEDNEKFDFLVVDEAHYVKNPEAIRSRNVKEICEHTERIMFLTGTALENKTEEMVSLIKYLQPKIAEKIKDMSEFVDAAKFREKVAPVYFRRKREDVLKELPELIENEDWCTMTPHEENVYENSVLSKNFMKSRRVSWNVDDLKDSSKAQRLLEIVEEAKEEDRKIIVFSYFLDTIKKIHSMLGTKCIGPINGSVSPQKRQELIDEFEKSSDGTVLLAQIEAGGTGLNIQAASVVVICEPQLKPSIENQAISRAYRMGQSRNVLVHRLLCEDSIDERITKILEEKQEIFDQFADKSVAAQKANISETKLISNLIDEEINRINEKRKTEVH